MPSGKRIKPFLPNFSPARSDIPKRFRYRVAARTRILPGLDLPPAPRYIDAYIVSRLAGPWKSLNVRGHLITDFAASRRVFARRVFFAALVLATIAALFALTAYALSAGGLTFTDGVLLLLYGLTMPWAVIGFWNGIIGFVVMRCARDPVAAVNPAAAHGRSDEPITVSTALTIFVRNEPPHRVIRNLGTMMRELTAAGVADKFHLYVLSDTNSCPRSRRSRRTGFAALADQWRGRFPITYRRREINTGFKAGNFWDFCQHWGDDHELAVTLDTDSFMTAAAIMRMVRIMQADPKLGILQGLVAGLPTTSAFARIFQFGMRLGMQSFTIGSAWWQADCGPYWGHNAALRIAPFKKYCEIPKLPGKGVLRGHVLSHDQIEAALDAARRLRCACAAGGKSRLGREPADADRIHPARSALAAGNAAIRVLPVPARTEIRQPLPACVCDDDVSRLAGVDRPARRRHARDRVIAVDGGLHPRRRGLRAALGARL